MISSFRSKSLRRLFEDGDARGLNPQHVGKLTRMLDRLDIVSEPSEMSLPGWKNHPLTQDRKGFWGVWVSGNYRLIYRIEQGDAYDVEYLDYH